MTDSDRQAGGSPNAVEQPSRWTGILAPAEERRRDGTMAPLQTPVRQESKEDVDRELEWEIVQRADRAHARRRAEARPEAKGQDLDDRSRAVSRGAVVGRRYMFMRWFIRL